jgi:chorismate lyase / 3-hydroxybenzoate synthase
VNRPAVPPTEALRGPRLVDANELRRLAADGRSRVLSVTRFGFPPSGPSPWLTARVPNRPLADAPAAEIWPSTGEVAHARVHGVDTAADGAAMFATLEIDGITGGTLERATRDAYERLMRAAGSLGYPHFVRMWNFVPAINDRSEGLERYMLFCKGRSEAFSEHAGDTTRVPLPAASAVGCPGDALVVHALAAREPGEPVENPRQVSAYRYPERYGPKPPSFARGIKAPRPWQGALFVSGTASIRGHESVFPGDPAAQTEETLRNIASVLDAAGIGGAGRPLGTRLDALRIYVRHDGDRAAVLNAIERSLGRAVPSVWLQAEICREELLVEIEATVLAPAP